MIETLEISRSSCCRLRLVKYSLSVWSFNRKIDDILSEFEDILSRSFVLFVVVHLKEVLVFFIFILVNWKLPSSFLFDPLCHTFWNIDFFFLVCHSSHSESHGRLLSYRHDRTGWSNSSVWWVARYIHWLVHHISSKLILHLLVGLEGNQQILV